MIDNPLCTHQRQRKLVPMSLNLFCPLCCQIFFLFGSSVLFLGPCALKLSLFFGFCVLKLSSFYGPESTNFLQFWPCVLNLFFFLGSCVLKCSLFRVLCPQVFFCLGPSVLKFSTFQCSVSSNHLFVRQISQIKLFHIFSSVKIYGWI